LFEAGCDVVHTYMDVLRLWISVPFISLKLYAETVRQILIQVQRERLCVIFCGVRILLPCQKI
jgi:hypothetical protein